MLSYRRGLSDRVELDASVSYLGVGARQYFPEVDLRTGSVRLGCRYTPLKAQDIVTMWIGAGSGISEIGSYGGYDLGVCAGYPGRVTVPFAYAGLFGSWPYGEESVLFRDSTEVTPEPTRGGQFGLGVRFWSDERGSGDTDVGSGLCMLVGITVLGCESYGVEIPFFFGGGLEVVF